ncbi:MAG TPA: SGNH/GDSL hydrolase family protein [Pyrinomonadaceae bacterium]
MRLLVWQTIYLAAAAVILPVSPLLFLQGQYTRRKVGLLPEAGGDKFGLVGVGVAPAKLLVMGESTVAGLGASTHDKALAGRFAQELSARIQKPVEWNVVGRNGVTAKRTIEELIPLVPDRVFDYILLGLGGNDVMKLSSPRKWRRDMTQLLGILREKNPDAIIFISNCPMIKYSPAIPHPVKFLLWELSKMHDANIKDFTAGMERVFYYHQPADVKLDGFFADGIHPSEQGYADWSAAMMRFFNEQYKW